MIFSFNEIAGGTGVNPYNQGIVVLPGNGNGTFQAPVITTTYSSTTAPFSTFPPHMVAVTDFNGDGNPDLLVNIPGTVVTNFQLQNQLEVFLGNGDGTFKTPIPIASVPDLYGIPVVADLNKDGKLDLAFLAETSGSQAEIVIALGNGDGTFATPSILDLSGGDAIRNASLTAGDFNNDGNLDLALFDSEDFSGIFYGNGTGAFTSVNIGTASAPILIPQDLIESVRVGTCCRRKSGCGLCTRHPCRQYCFAQCPRQGAHHDDDAHCHRHALPIEYHHRAVDHGHRRSQRRKRRSDTDWLRHSEQRDLHFSGHDAHQRKRRHHRARRFLRGGDGHTHSYLHARLDQFLRLQRRNRNGLSHGDCRSDSQLRSQQWRQHHREPRRNNSQYFDDHRNAVGRIYWRGCTHMCDCTGSCQPSSDLRARSCFCHDHRCHRGNIDAHPDYHRCNNNGFDPSQTRQISLVRRRRRKPGVCSVLHPAETPAACAGDAWHDRSVCMPRRGNCELRWR